MKNLDELFVTSGQVLSLGPLHLPSGRVVACDPFFVGIAEPFTRAVRPGSYDVELCIADVPLFGSRVVLARIAFQPGKRTARMEEATKDGGFGYYTVEAGLGSFMDATTAKEFALVMARFYRENPGGNYYTDVLAAELKRSAKRPDDPWDAGRWNVHVLPGSDRNVAMFRSGLGDGSYSSYWGVAEDGEVVSLVTDFGVLDDPDDDPDSE